MPAKRIVVCADGTWNTPHPLDGSPPTNVVHISRAVAPHGPSGEPQTVFYSQGIGTRGRLDYYLSGYTGRGLSNVVLDCYQFLAKNYAPGDTVYLFGFSRGAFAVRILSRLLDACGLLRTIDLDSLPEFWLRFRAAQASVEDARLDDVRRSSVHPFAIQFLGVWDTVEALGLPLPGLRQMTRPRLPMHDYELAANVANASHALAIDEIRSAFIPSLWINSAAPGQHIEQVWFPGVHADCGGGYRHRGLSDLTLAWMIGRAGQCGLAFDREYVARHVSPIPRQPPHKERSGFHRVLPAGPRPILETSPATEWIHESALERFRDAGSGYRPANLAAAIERHGESWVWRDS